MKLNTQILREIAFQINVGNPYWGMLFCNEYLQPNDYLHKALAHRFIERTSNSGNLGELAKSLIRGATARDLPEKLSQLVGARVVRKRIFAPLRSCATSKQSYRRGTFNPTRRPTPVRINARPFSPRADSKADRRLELGR